MLPCHLRSHPPRVVPWRIWAEWEETFRLLYSSVAADRVVGYHHVEVWRCRMTSRLPLAIDTTASLVATQLLDFDHIPHSIGVLSARLLYSAIIVRFINGIADHSQKKKFAVSINTIADSIGLPRFLIDIRHEATHGTLPSLSMCRHAVIVTLSWLCGHYWLPQQQKLIDIRNLTVYHFQQCEELLQNAEIVDASSSKNIRSRRKKNKKKKIATSVSYITAVSSWNSAKVFVMPLLAHRFLSCGAYGMRENEESYNSAVACKSHLWSTVLLSLGSQWPNFIDALFLFFISSILSYAHNSSDTQNPSIWESYAWAKQLLPDRSLTGTCCVSQNGMIRALSMCLNSPNYWSVLIIDAITNLVGPNSSSMSYFHDAMLKIPRFLGSFNKTENSDSIPNSVISRIDISAIVDPSKCQDQTTLSDVQRNDVNSDIIIPWSVCEHWELCPLGMLPNGELPNLWLDINDIIEVDFLVETGEKSTTMNNLLSSSISDISFPSTFLDNKSSKDYLVEANDNNNDNDIRPTKRLCVSLSGSSMKPDNNSSDSSSYSNDSSFEIHLLSLPSLL